jgi:hypothetical protein
MELNIGSNIFRNTNGVLKVDGREQVVLQIRDEAPRLFVTMDLYDPAGQHVAHLRKNAWRFNHQDRFELQQSPVSASLFTYPISATLIDRSTKDTVLEVQLVDHNLVHIPRGRLHSHTGRLMEITPHFWRFPGQPTKFGTVFDARGMAAVIG